MKPVNLARMSAFDIVGGNLEARNTAHKSVFADENIGLVHSCKYLSIRFFYSCNPLDRNIGIRFCDRENFEVRLGLISDNVGNNREISILHEDSFSGKFYIFAYLYVAIFFSFSRDNSVLHRDIFRYNNLHIFHISHVDNMAIFFDMLCWLCNIACFHNAIIKIFPKKQLYFFI